MGNAVYIFSVILAAIWLISYFLLGATSPLVHLLILASFFGIAISLFMEQQSNKTFKQHHN